MPDIRPLKNNTNAAILDAIRNDSSADYVRRIPNATEAGVSATLESLTKYRPAWNEFVDALINRIGTVIARNMSWTNPLAMFKRGMLYYGNTIEEIQVGLLDAHIYDPDREYMEKDLFGTERPWVESNFHSVNRQEFYKVTVNDHLLKRAFIETDGLSKFITSLMQAPITSDNVAEFELTTKLISEYEKNDGFYHVNVPNVLDLTSDEADAKAALRKLRAMAGNLQFPSTKYNATHMPTFANQDELIILASPEFQAAIDVEALAGAFNMDKAQAMGRIITIPQTHFGVNGMQAILTVPDFFVIADNILENTSQYNPAALQTNYFLHHHEIISASRFVPAVAFWTGADDEVINISGTITSVSTITNDNGTTATATLKPGDIAAYSAAGVGTAENKSVVWSVSGNNSNKTYITNYGVLHIGIDETAADIIVKAESAWVNPSSPANNGVTPATLTVTIDPD